MIRLFALLFTIAFAGIINAQTISTEETEYFNQLMLVTKNPAKYYRKVNRSLLEYCFYYSKPIDDSKVLETIEQLKANDSLRYRYYGIVRYFTNNNERILNRFLTIEIRKGSKYVPVLSATVKQKIAHVILGTSFNYEQYLLQGIDTTEKIYEAPSVNAQFPGGEQKLFMHIQMNLEYPAEERDNDIQGNVIIQCVVEKNGVLSHFVVKQQVAEGLDNEAIRVLKLLPRFEPARENNLPVRSHFVLPVMFKLQ